MPYGDALLDHIEKSLLPRLWAGGPRSRRSRPAELSLPSWRACTDGLVLSPVWRFRCA